MRIAVVGATGAVGTELLGLLAASQLTIEQIVPIASGRSAGRELPPAGSIPLGRVIALDDVGFTGVDVAFFTAGAAVSRRTGEKAASTGCLVIDNSSAFRMRDDVPLPVPQVNPQVLDRRPESGIIANPNCSTIQLVRALAPLHEVAGLRRVVVSTYQAASGGGLVGLSQLASDSRTVLDKPSARRLYPRHEIANKAAEGERARRSPLSRVMFESSAPATTGSPHPGDPG